MTSEIEKMYELAGFERSKPPCAECFLDRHSCCRSYDECPELYPPFTAEKQIKLIKFLLKNYEGIDISKRINRFNFLVDNATFNGCQHNDKNFEESLAGVINKLWANMPEEEKQQIKEILE